jgi:outer membrane lipoprotein-sorting protein
MRKPGSLRLSAFALILITAASATHAETVDSLKKRLAAQTSSIHNMRGTMIVHPASRSEAKEINKGILEFLDHGFREAQVFYVRPDKFRAEGKAKGVDVSYVLNGNTKQVLAPSMMLKKTDDLTNERSRKQTTLDLGFASDTLWRDFNVKIVSQSGGQIKIRLTPKGDDAKRHEIVTLDAKTLKVLVRERYKGDGKLKSRNVYSAHKTFGKVPIATMVKVNSADGGSAGSIEMKNIKINTELSPTLFAIK